MHRPRGAWEGPAQAGGTGTPMSAEGFGACGGVPWDARSLSLGGNGSRSIPASGWNSDPATRLTGEPFNRWVEGQLLLRGRSVSRRISVSVRRSRL